MAIDFRRTSIFFDPTTGQIQSEPAAVVFNSRVIRADVALNGFDVQFTNGEHPLLRQMIDARIERFVNDAVFVRVEFLLRDDSGNIDDPFAGRVDVLVIAEVEERGIGLTSV